MNNHYCYQEVSCQSFNYPTLQKVILSVLAVSDNTSPSILFFTLYIFQFCNGKSFFLPSTFFQVYKYKVIFLYFVLFLFGLKAQNALYHLESFYIMAFCSTMLEQVLQKIYNYVIIKHVAHDQETRQLSNSADKHTKINIFLEDRILEL